MRDCRLMLVGAVVAAGLAGATPARAEDAAEPQAFPPHRGPVRRRHRLRHRHRHLRPGRVRELGGRSFPLPVVIPFPQGYHDLRYNPDKHVLAIMTGEGPVRAAASIEALANDRRFDVSHAYWLFAGIAGVDPNVDTVGSAAWAEYVVDGDLAHEIDAREIPKGWSTGYVPLGRSRPYQKPVPPASSGNGTSLFRLNEGFRDWAYKFSKAHVTLPDTANLQKVRSLYQSYPATQHPPQIVKGDVMGSGTFWLGDLLNRWAEDWVSYWSHGKGTFTMTSEEDAGYAQALTFLSRRPGRLQARARPARGQQLHGAPPRPDGGGAAGQRDERHRLLGLHREPGRRLPDRQRRGERDRRALGQVRDARAVRALTRPGAPGGAERPLSTARPRVGPRSRSAVLDLAAHAAPDVVPVELGLGLDVAVVEFLGVVAR